jgi:hypothetical protein
MGAHGLDRWMGTHVSYLQAALQHRDFAVLCACLRLLALLAGGLAGWLGAAQSGRESGTAPQHAEPQQHHEKAPGHAAQTGGVGRAADTGAGRMGESAPYGGQDAQAQGT